jgi:hypothetical protein
MANPPKSKAFDWEMYRYIPSLIAAILALVIFGIMAMLHFWQWLRSRNHIIIYVVIGTLGKYCSEFLTLNLANTSRKAEIGGYGARIGSHFDNVAWGPFIVQSVLLLTGPLFFAATIYMMLGRTIRLAGGEDISLIKPTWYTKIFVGADITTMILQGLGAFHCKAFQELLSY